MMAFHELGHVVSTLANGGTIDEVKLVPWAFSYTMRHGSALPVVDIWAGALTGTLIPLIIWLSTLRFDRLRLLAGLFAGFCCVVNGIYFGIGWLDNVGDTGELLALDFPVWPMIVFGVVAICGGFWLWHVEVERAKSLNQSLNPDPPPKDPLWISFWNQHRLHFSDRCFPIHPQGFLYQV
ncbi:MAG: hypothetical protein PF442_08375 [Desulfobulbaceae bacterium]|nr:hypothetical protein [Desulfobulbaceae bacterium]